ncbi:MAG TPA: protein meaA [Firmicutes bacterium]|nr:protein meaA [Bacillota bacterium]
MKPGVFGLCEQKAMKKLRVKKQQWERVLANHGRSMPFYKEHVTTAARITIAPLYTPADLPGFSYEEELGFPGEYPFTRGITPSMYRSRVWDVRQTLGLGNTCEQNKRFHRLLTYGINTLPVAFDLPTQVGYDSDHPMAYGEVGRVGVAIDSLADMETLFAGIPLDQVITTMNISAPAPVILAMYLVLAEKRGIPWQKLQGVIQNDILKEYVARGSYIFPPKSSLRLATDLLAFCTEHVPQWYPLAVSGYHIREAGATAVQELAFTLANAITYVAAALEAGQQVDAFAPRITFYFSSHAYFFEEVAKLRAARRLWAKIMKNRFGARTPEAQMMRMHVETAGSTLTESFPDVNTIRVAYQALAAVLAGTQSLHTSHRDNMSPLPNVEAELLARYTQELLANETGITDSIDPLGGSYYVEALTTAIEKKTAELIARIEAQGGTVGAIENGYMQREVENSAYDVQKRIENNELFVIGRNTHLEERQPPRYLPEMDPLAAERHITALKELKRKRDQQKVAVALQELRRAAQGPDNIMPAILNAVRALATVGEICGILREVYGECRCPGNTGQDGAERPVHAGKEIRVLIAKAGLDGHDRGAKVVVRALREAGMTVYYTGLRQSPEEIVTFALEKKVHVVGISTLCGAHLQILLSIPYLLRENGAENVLVIAGGIIPEEDVPHLKKVGISRIFLPGTRTDEIVRYIRERV